MSSKGNKICLITIAICTVLVIAFCGFIIYKHKDKDVSDNIRFKEEYEAYNGLKNESNNKDYLEVSIENENPIIYKSPKEILDVLKEEYAVIYFGFASCPWCRNVVEPLLSAAKEKNIDKVYYVDIYDIRDSYELDGTIFPKQTKKGTDAYYEILKFLDDKLEKYYIKDENGNMYDTGVKRLYAPTVLVVSNGSVKGLHVSTIDEQKDPYEKLTDEQKEKLKNIYVEMMKEIEKKLETCDGKDAC